VRSLERDPFQIESDRTLNFLSLSMILSEKSATSRDHALGVAAATKRSQR